MDPQKPVFRKSALDNLSSPEQLDQLMQVTTPKSWLALIACGALVLTALVWSIVGSIPTKVLGRGILIKKGGVFVATSRGVGNVIQVLAEPGDLIEEDEVIAEIRQPELELQIDQGQGTLNRLQQELERLKRFQAEEKTKERESFDRQGEIFRALIRDYDTNLLWLNQRIDAQTKLQASQLVTESQVLDTRIKLFSVQHEREQASIQWRQLELTELQADERRRQLLQTKEEAVNQAQNQLAYLRNLHDLNTQIKSPFRGSVLEIMVKAGQLLSVNTPILSLQADERALKAYLYLSPADGKVVTNEMKVAVSPVSVKKEKYGFMVGHVSRVSQFPMTRQGMLRVLENQSLVDDFSRNGAPIEVEVSFETDSNTMSGFKWSSRNGPPVRISSGTLADGLITVTEQRPISMVLPMIKKGMGM